MTAKINPALLAQIAAGASLKTDIIVSDVSDIHVVDIVINPHQPRLEIAAVELQELAESIRLHGLIQPIAVARTDSGYQLISGHRRLEAHKVLGRDTVRANIIDADEDDLAVLALIENVQRSDLHPLEVALAISKEPFTSMRDDEISAALGYSVTKLRNIRAILRLENLVLEHIREHKPSIGIDVLVEIQKLPDVEQYCTYMEYLDSKIDRAGIRTLLRAYNDRVTPKISKPISRIGTGYKIDCKAILETNRVNFEEELKQLLEKYTLSEIK